MFVLFSWEDIAFTLIRVGSAGISSHKDFPNTSVSPERKLVADAAADTLELFISGLNEIEDGGRVLYVGETTGELLGFCHVLSGELTESVKPDAILDPEKLKSIVSLYNIFCGFLSSVFFCCNGVKSLIPKMFLSLDAPALFGGTAKYDEALNNDSVSWSVLEAACLNWKQKNMQYYETEP